MINRIILVFFVSTIFYTVSALEVSLSAGMSKFTYVEISENLKEDMYEVDSFLAGVGVNQKIGIFEMFTTLKAQLPYNATFKDLYGTDSTNYLVGHFYYGLNVQAGLMYPIIDNKFRVKAGVLFNYDFFYFKDEAINIGTETIFSVLGNGIKLDLSYNLNNKYTFGATGSYDLNYLPLHKRGYEFKWSTNLTFGLYFGYIIY